MENKSGEAVWYTVLDTTTGKHFYANPSTGECKWKKPKDGNVIEGTLPVWWELYDSNTKAPYYFNAITQETHWSMPENVSVFPIPLSSEDDAHLNKRLGKYDEEEEEVENAEFIIEDDAIDENEAEQTVVKNWEEHEDPRTGYKYYLHRRTKKLTWSMLEAFQETLKEESVGIINTNKVHQKSRVNLPPQNNNQNIYNAPQKKSPLKKGPPKLPVTKKPDGRSVTPLGKRGPTFIAPKQEQTTVVSSKSESKLPNFNRPPSNSLSHHNLSSNKAPPLPSTSIPQLRAPAKSFSDHSKKPTNAPPPLPQTKKVTNTSPNSSFKLTLEKSISPQLSGSPPPTRKNHPKLTRVNTIGSTSNNNTISQFPKNIDKESFILSLESVVGKGLKQNLEASPPRNKHYSDRSPKKEQPSTRKKVQKSFSFINRKTLSARDTNPPRPVMPDLLKKQLNFFQLEGYAQQYFKNVKRGIFRRAVPIRERLKYSKDSIKEPLLKLKSDYKSKSITLFKNIQIYMGDRAPGTSYEDKLKALEVNMNLGLNIPELRDEFYCQVCKQVTLNPNIESLQSGWALLTLIVQYFPPTKDLEPWLEQFLKEHEKNAEDIFKKYINYSILRLTSITRQGAILRNPTTVEIDHSLKAALREPIFSSTLSEVNKSHQNTGSVPKILTSLLNRLKELNAHKTEGIFRISGGVEECIRMKMQIENGNYNFDSYNDPHVPASVLKFWFRSLDEPLIPPDYYWKCIDAVKEDNTQKMIKILKSLPKLNYNVLVMMNNFLQELIKPENQKVTKMGIQNIAIVFGPNFVRCPSSDPGVILRTQQHEQNFMLSLIRDFHG